MIKSGDFEQMKRITALKIFVRDDILADFVRCCMRKDIRYVCAFMEAEWELCRLKKDGVIDVVVSKDWDCFVLGCRTLIQLLGIKVDPLGPNCSMTTGSCWVDYVANFILDPSSSEFADFAVLLSVDYLDRGNSVNKVSRLFANWRSIKEDTLLQIESNGQVSRTCIREGLPGYMKRFWEASHIFQFAPYFCVISLLEGQSIRDVFWSDSYKVVRENLSAIPEGSDEASLFGLNPNILLPIQFQL